jgi:hypothetical protein
LPGFEKRLHVFRNPKHYPALEIWRLLLESRPAVDALMCIKANEHCPAGDPNDV